MLPCDLVRNNARKLYNFRQPALSVMHRIVGSLEPDIATTGIDSFETIRDVLATVERLPEILILGRFRLLSGAKQTMMFSNNLA
ncbi:hypothetical protein D3C79_839800 [compost metagenome]